MDIIRLASRRKPERRPLFFAGTVPINGRYCQWDYATPPLRSMDHEPSFLGPSRQRSLVYLDDIFLYSRMEEDHMELLQEVFRRLGEVQAVLEGYKVQPIS